MIIILINDTNRIVYAICKCILFPQSSVVIALHDKKSAKDAFRIARKLCNTNARKEILNSKDNNINFKNQSNLAFEYPKPKVEPEYIRGHRTELPLIYFDDFNIDEETLNEVLKPYVKRKEYKTMEVSVDLDVLRIVYEASLSVCDNCTSDDCGICDIRKSQDKVSELLREGNIKHEII